MVIDTALSLPAARDAKCPFDPPPELRKLQDQAPLVRVRIWDGSTPWLVTRHADQRQLLTDPRLSADPTKPGYPLQVERRAVSGRGGIGFIMMDDPEHNRLRRMVTAPFAIKRVEALRPGIQRIVDDLIDRMLAGPKPADLVEAFALPVPSLVICQLLGVPYEDHALFQSHSRNLISRSSTPEVRGASFEALHDYLSSLLATKDADGDLLSQLAERVGNGELSRGDAAGIGVLLLVAGHETTANMISLGTLALLENPDQLALLRDSDDPKLVASAVEELLRYLTITHTGRRRVALADIEIAGTTVRAGEGVILPNDIGNRDPGQFPDPDRLDVTRDAGRHLAFGFGVHQCLGQPLARVELQVVYSTLYRRIPTLHRTAELADIPFKHDGGVYGVHELPVSW
ncbi:cytochrome P450 [Actinoplanes couchii]|uniref:Cytochrome P450 n=1 Tax=Actinoplanes couchii TaxID=403638 RepID=A0ABQ3XNS7_9ACTN|nr:cytochrome P450 [Actinoplanes couchii]MDR6319640.1 cytochrome P450 [Actinoplanes couchii]GID60138.1 cytochrome P450 [Actinoplanes couchii]